MLNEAHKFFTCASVYRKGIDGFLNVFRFSGQLVMGYLFGVLGNTAIPSDFMEAHSYLHLIVPWAVAVGVNLVGNVGREKTTMKWGLVGALCGFPIYLHNNSDFTYMTLFASIAINWKGKSAYSIHEKYE